MATGVSGYLPSFYMTNVYVPKYGGMYIQPHYVEEWYAEGNYSIVKIDHINFTSSMYSQSVGWDLTGRISINGKEYSYGGSVTTSNYTATSWPCSIVSDPIYHNTDGSKAITITLTYTYVASSQVGARWSDEGTVSTASVTLTTIPLASTIVATDANVGSVSQITVTRKSTNYSHSIQYAFGALSGYITSSGGISSDFNTFTTTSIGFTIPEAFYTQIPNSKTGTCTLRVTTYSGNTQIGDAKTCTFTVTAAESLCAPLVSGTVVDTNEATIALTGSADILVRYMSDALCTISTEAKNSATVSSKTIAGVTVTDDTRTITGIETDTVTFGVTDSRGYSNSVDVTKSFVPYIKLTNDATAARPDPTSGKVTLKIEGSCFNGNFGVVDNIVNATYSVNSGNPVDATVVMSGNAYSITLNLTGFDYQKSHSIEVVVTDKLMTVSRTLPIQKGIPVFDWGEDDFRFNVPVDIDGSLNVSDAEATRNNLEITPENIGAVKKSGDTMTGALNTTYLNVKRPATSVGFMQAYRDNVRTALFQQPIESNQLQLCQCPVGDGTYVEGYKFPIPATELTGHKWYDILTSKTVTAYVIAHGWYDGWYYRKWSNGRAEVWGDLWYSGASSNGWVYFNKAYPFPFTVNPRVVYSTVSQSVYDHWIGQTSLDPTQFNGVKLFCNSNEKVGGCIMVYAYGEWY